MPPKRKITRDAGSKPSEANEESTAKNGGKTEPADVVALFRLLLREPTSDHNFATCPTCKRYGLTRI